MGLKFNTRFLLISALLSGFFLFVSVISADESNGKKAELERQIAGLENEAKILDDGLQQSQNETRTLTNETKLADAEIKRRELEIKRLTLAIKKTELEIQNKIAGITSLSKKIGKSRKALAAGLFLLYTYQGDNIFTALLRYNNISEFFTTLFNLTQAENSIHRTIIDFREERTVFQKEKEELEEFEKEQEDLKALQEIERRSLAQKKKEKEDLLRLTRGKEAIFQQLLQLKKRDIATLKTQLFYLEKTGVTAEDAIKFADLAAKRAGIRTAFLLALLEVETGREFEEGVISVGTNLGTGNWKRDLYDCYVKLGRRRNAEAEKAAFFKITGKLGLDPDKMPVSRKPSYGCGGAMGAAQFLPTTWLRFESRVAALTGHDTPNPWNVEDAFTAAALFLADSGARSQTSAGELAAAKTYLSGSPTCSRYVCRSYANRILSLARDIDRIL